MGFGLVIGFSEHLEIITTNTRNYSAAINPNTLQVTIGHTSSQHVRIFASSCLVADFNGGHSTVFGVPNCPSLQPPASNSNSSQRLNLSRSLTHRIPLPVKVMLRPSVSLPVSFGVKRPSETLDQMSVAGLLI
jgi:hypothetical protein